MWACGQYGLRFYFLKYSEAGLVDGAVVADVFQIPTAYLH